MRPARVIHGDPFLVTENRAIESLVPISREAQRAKIRHPRPIPAATVVKRACHLDTVLAEAVAEGERCSVGNNRACRNGSGCPCRSRRNRGVAGAARGFAYPNVGGKEQRKGCKVSSTFAVIEAAPA